MIIIDSREKKFEHIEHYLKKNGIQYEIRKLDTGDYFNTDNPSVVIDRKANLQEVCTNLSSGKSNYSRFVRECRRAFEDHIRFVVLIEGTNYKEVKDIKNWQSKFSRHNGRWLSNEMFRLTMAYKVEWKFCRKNETPKQILEVLEYDQRRDQRIDDNDATSQPVWYQG